MPKNIVICCDGTANEFTAHNTNVLKLYCTLEQDPPLFSGVIDSMTMSAPTPE